MVFLSAVLPDLSSVVLFGACIDGVVLRDKWVVVLYIEIPYLSDQKVHLIIRRIKRKQILSAGYHINWFEVSRHSQN